MISILKGEFTSVEDVELLFTSSPQSSTQAAVGLLSTRAFPVPLTVTLMQMGGEQKLHVQPAEGTSVMFSRVKGSLPLRMSAIA